jgi:hypothetical protein
MVFFTLSSGMKSFITHKKIIHMLNTLKKYFGLATLLSVTTITLFACGGGSSSSPTLNLFAAYKTFAEEGYFLPGVISGYCQGTRAQTFQPGVLGVNPNTPPVPAFIQSVSETDVLAPNQPQLCQTFYSNPAFTVYFDPDAFTPQSDLSGSGYVYANQVTLPTSVTAGSKGTYYTSQKFNTTDPNNPVLVFNTVNTWEVKADTATTLLYITTNTATTPSDQLLYKSITTYRINANNTLTDLRKNIQASNIATGGNGDQNIYETYEE